MSLSIRRLSGCDAAEAGWLGVTVAGAGGWLAVGFGDSSRFHM